MSTGGFEQAEWSPCIAELVTRWLVFADVATFIVNFLWRHDVWTCLAMENPPVFGPVNPSVIAN